jgi:hypothetical protein
MRRLIKATQRLEAGIGAVLDWVEEHYWPVGLFALVMLTWGFVATC